MRKFYYKILCIFIGLTRFFFKRNLRVLAFHDVPDQAAFSKQIKYLKSHYNIIDIETLRESVLFEDKTLPNYSLLITFDDGHRSILKNALPVLIENNISSCIFIVTNYINSSQGFWWKRVRENEKKNKNSPQEITKHMILLKKIKNKERLKIVESYPPIPQKQLSTKDLLYMQKNGMFIGNHTHTHPMLDTCTKSEIQNELTTSKILFDEWNIEGFKVFAYPNGSWDSQSENLLKKNGIELAFLFDHKLNPSKISPLRISRIRANAGMPLSEFKVKVSGLHSLISNYR